MPKWRQTNTHTHFASRAETRAFQPHREDDVSQTNSYPGRHALCSSHPSETPKSQPAQPAGKEAPQVQCRRQHPTTDALSVSGERLLSRRQRPRPAWLREASRMAAAAVGGRRQPHQPLSPLLLLLALALLVCVTHGFLLPSPLPSPSPSPSASASASRRVHRAQAPALRVAAAATTSSDPPPPPPPPGGPVKRYNNNTSSSNSSSNNRRRRGPPPPPPPKRQATTTAAAAVIEFSMRRAGYTPAADLLEAALGGGTLPEECEEGLFGAALRVRAWAGERCWRACMHACAG